MAYMLNDIMKQRKTHYAGKQEILIPCSWSLCALYFWVISCGCSFFLFLFLSGESIQSERRI